MRVLFTLVLALATMYWPAPPAVAGGDDALVYLLPDGVDRYRPVLDAAGSVRVLADIDSITAPAMSPDGSRVAFSGSVGDESLGRYAIFLVNPNGSGLTQLTSGSLSEMDPSWSPDGDIIVVSQNQRGGLTSGPCCRLALAEVETGEITGLTGNVGALRPSYSPQGSFIVYDAPGGVWRIPASGGSPTQITSYGFDATVSPDESRVAFVARVGSSMEIQIVSSRGGSATTVLTTSGRVENPQWRHGRIYFVHHSGDGYDARSDISLRSVAASGGDLRIHRSFGERVVEASLGYDNDEMFFYRDDGSFGYYHIRPDGTLPSPLLEGDGYTVDWSAITAVDLDGDGQDEMFFYRDDGLFRYYHIRPDGTLPPPLLEGEGYTVDWSAITAVDLDGDGQDEMFFYRDDGLYRYYNIRPDGNLGPPIEAGDDYPSNWTSINAIDLDGDGQDEMFFYRDDGQFGFFEVDSSGLLGPAISEGDGYPTGWDVITSIDLQPE